MNGADEWRDVDWPYLVAKDRRGGQLSLAMGDGSQPLGPKLCALRSKFEELERNGALCLSRTPGCGMGVSLTKPYKGQIGVYCGALGLDKNADEHSDALFQITKEHRRFGGLTIDSEALGKRRPLYDLGRLNHSCQNANVRVSREVVDGRLLIIANTKGALPVVGDLRWDYNAKKREGYLVSKARKGVLRSLGIPVKNCRCAGRRVCPLRRGMINYRAMRRAAGKGAKPEVVATRSEPPVRVKRRRMLPPADDRLEAWLTGDVYDADHLYKPVGGDRRGEPLGKATLARGPANGRGRASLPSQDCSAVASAVRVPDDRDLTKGPPERRRKRLSSPDVDGAAVLTGDSGEEDGGLEFRGTGFSRQGPVGESEPSVTSGVRVPYDLDFTKGPPGRKRKRLSSPDRDGDAVIAGESGEEARVLGFRGARLSRQGPASVAPGRVELLYDPSPGGAERSSKLVREGIKEDVIRAMGPQGHQLVWGRARFPVVTNLFELRHSGVFRKMGATYRDAFLQDSSPKTALEDAGTGMIGVSLGSGKSTYTFDELSQVGREMFEPGRLAPGTRVGYETGLRKVRSIFIAKGKPEEALPMSPQRLKNVLVEAALAGEPVASLRVIASAIAELHRSVGLISPTVTGGGLDRLLKPFEVSLGKAQAQINPVTAANMSSMALLTGTDLKTERAVVMTMFGTVIAGRNEHVAGRRLCDAQEDYDVDKGEEFSGGFAFNIQRQKQDRVGAGCKPRAAPGPFTRRLKK